MKNILFSLIALCLLCTQTLAQAPNKFNYQAVAKTAGGTPISGVIGVRFTLLDGSASGTEVYKEEHAAVTADANGLFSVQIGGGQATGGTNWSNVNWSSGAKYLKVEIKQGTNPYNQVGTPQELVSVPYSMNSKGLELPFLKQNDQPNPSFQINNSQGDALRGISSGFQKSGVRGEYYGDDGAALSGWANGTSAVGLSATNASGNWGQLATSTRAALFNGIIEANNSLLQINNGGSFVQTGCDPNPFLELKGKSGTAPYIDFSSDLNDDYGARILYDKANNALDFAGPSSYTFFGNAAVQNIIGQDHAYFAWYPKGGGAGRKAWMGYGDAGTHDFVIANSEWGDGSGAINLHTGYGRVRVVGPGFQSGIDFVPDGTGSGWGFLGFNGSGSLQLIAPGHMDYTSQGGGYHNFYGSGIWVHSAIQQELSNYTYFKNAGVPLSYPVVVPLATQYITGGGGVVGYSVYANERIACSELDVFSDRRIKNITGISDSRSDLEVLNKIEITDYFFKDYIAKGAKPQKKVIGQQVAEVYPQAVSTDNKEIVPDIMQMATADKGWVSLKGHDLKKGDKVRLIFEKGKEELEVTEATPEGFRVVSDKSGEVFVYGREVSDFHIVDYEAIAMLNVSATQELSKQVSDLKKQIADRDAQLTAALDLLQTLRQEVAALKTAPVLAREEK